MKSTDTITVLVCCHSVDHEHDFMLADALESLAAQTYDKFDVVLVLDECWGHTIPFLERRRVLEDLDVQVHSRPHKKGLANAKNFGLKFCDGDWIAYLDGDDQWMDCKLEIQRDYLLDFQTIDLCGTEAWDSYDGVLKPNYFSIGKYQYHKDIASALPRENVLMHGSMIIRRSVLELLDGYDESERFLGCEDWELWLRALHEGYKFGKVPERICIYGMGTGVKR